MAPPKVGFRARFREWVGNDNSPKKNEQKFSLKEEVISKKEYVLEATQQVLEILKSAAGLAPVPLLKEALELGINVLNLCRSMSKVTEQIRSLRDRMAELLLVVAKVAKEFPVNLESTLATFDTNDLMEDLRLLCGCLNEVYAKLQGIAAQNRFLTTFLSQASQGVIDECSTQFRDVVIRFQVLRALRDSLDLSRIRGQLIEVYGLNKVVAASVADIRDEVHEVKATVDSIHTFLHHDAFDVQLPIVTKAPRVPRVFIGRDAYVDEIVSRLTMREPNMSRICVLGPGGAGKTSVASAIAHHAGVKERFDSCFWVSCIVATSSSAFLSTLCRSIGVQDQGSGAFSAIIEHLDRKNGRLLLILDNFETTWHPTDGNQKSIKDILEALDALDNLSILVTMRSEFPPLSHWSDEILPALKVEDSRQIYAALNKDEAATPGGQSKLDSLLSALGHLPYAVTLMATRAKASLSSPAELLAEWNESGTSMITTAEGGMDHSIRLSIQSTFVRNSPGAIHLLQVLSMLPFGVNRSDLGAWVKSCKTEALETLRSAALIQTTTHNVVDKNDQITEAHRLSVLPVVQSYMNHGDRIPVSVQNEVRQACFGILSRHKAALESPNHPGFRRAFASLYAQQENLRALVQASVRDELDALESEPPSSLSNDKSARRTFLLESVVAFIWYQQWSKAEYSVIYRPALALARKVGHRQVEADIWSSIFDSMGMCRIEKLTRRHGLVANYYRSIGNYQKAATLEYQQLYQIISTPTTIHDPTRLETTSNRLEDLNSAWEPFKDAHDRESRLVRAMALYGSAKIRIALDQDSQRQQAYQELREAVSIFTQLQKPYHVGLCFRSMAYALGLLGRYHDSLAMANEALACFRGISFGESGMAQNIASACLIKVGNLKLLGRWDDPELMTLLNTAMKLNRDVLGHKIPIAMVYDELGEVYLMREEWSAAKLAYEEAVKQGKYYVYQFPEKWNMKETVRRWTANVEFAAAKEKGLDSSELEWYEPHRFCHTL